MDEYPANFGTTPGKWRSKYQYFPVVEEIQTEFGQIKCDYGYYTRYCLRMPDDGGTPDNYMGHKMKSELMNR